MKIARLLVTLACPRTCEGCCNKYDSVMREMRVVTDLDQLLSYDQICITGGEPLLVPGVVLKLIRWLRWGREYKGKIFLYTAQYSISLRSIMLHLNGVHFSLHAPAAADDFDGLNRFQDLIKEIGGNQSFRLYVDSRVDGSLVIKPVLWSRVEIKPWIAEGACPLPPNETLLYLPSELIR